VNWFAVQQQSSLLRIQKELSELVDDSLICQFFLHGRKTSGKGQQNSKTLFRELREDAPGKNVA